MTETTPSEIDNSQCELEELSESVELPASPEPLAPGTSLDTPDGPLRTDTFVGCKGVVNLYEATVSDNRRVSLRETQDAGGAELMRHEFEVLRGSQVPVFHQAFACWNKDGRTNLATEPTAGKTWGTH